MSTTTTVEALAVEAPATPQLDEKALTFTLGDLIREGARQIPEQKIGAWGDEEAACALSAATIAAERLGIVPSRGA